MPTISSLHPLTDDPSKYDVSRLLVPRTRIPEELEVRRELGRGSNNRVFAAEWEGERCVLRAPRRKSDTQQRGSAVWEFRHMLKASQLGVGPEVYRAWCARHATGRWPSGLYAITERFSHDLEDALCRDRTLRESLASRRPALAKAIARCVDTLARENIFVYDLKPSNVVVQFGESGRDDDVTVKLIDFGRDFCEWAGCEADPESNTPCVTMLRKRVLSLHPDMSEEERAALVSHVLYAAMIVLLTATTTRVLHEDRVDHRMDARTREAVHPTLPLARDLLSGMQGRNIALVRAVLRMDDVRGVLRHYNGRRDAGTRRTFAMARGKGL